jgi:hypothetical protein
MIFVTEVRQLRDPAYPHALPSRLKLALTKLNILAIQRKQPMYRIKQK